MKKMIYQNSYFFIIIIAFFIITISYGLYYKYTEIDNIPLVNIQILKYYIGIFKRINENTIIIDINNNDDYKLLFSKNERIDINQYLRKNKIKKLL